LGIRFVEPGFHVHNRSQYFAQEFVPGESWSGAFLACESETWILATTRQWLQRDVSTNASGTTEFRYAGSSWSPNAPDHGYGEHWWRDWKRLGHVLASESGMRGLFGVDAIVTPTSDGSMQIVPIEVNPRYTASMELIDWAHERSAVYHHVRACTQRDYRPEITTTGLNSWAKAVLYADHGITVSESFLDYVREINRQTEIPGVKDFPSLNAQVPAGHPVITVFARGNSMTEAEATVGLRGSAGLLHDLRQALFGNTQGSKNK
jgi:predicted ATP-grasp superfamily ATP-dependent carboligase